MNKKAFRFKGFRRRLGRRAALTAAVAITGALAGCARQPTPEAYLAVKAVDAPKESSFMVCHGYDCTFRTRVALPPGAWSQVRAVFEPPPATPADERDRIVQAVSVLETAVGDRIGTKTDIPGMAGILGGDPTQLDCIDETVNATVYLVLLRDAGLLRWHEPGRPDSRGIFIDLRWHHETAVLREKATGEEFALDTWFRPNGARAYLVRLSDWEWGNGLPSYSLTPL
jgi:hypothetical protein